MMERGMFAPRRDFNEKKGISFGPPSDIICQRNFVFGGIAKLGFRVIRFSIFKFGFRV